MGWSHSRPSTKNHGSVDVKYTLRLSAKDRTMLKIMSLLKLPASTHGGKQPTPSLCRGICNNHLGPTTLRFLIHHSIIQKCCVCGGVWSRHNYTTMNDRPVFSLACKIHYEGSSVQDSDLHFGDIDKGLNQRMKGVGNLPVPDRRAQKTHIEY